MFKRICISALLLFICALCVWTFADAVSQKSTSKSVLSSAEAGKIVQDTVNKYFLQDKTTSALTGVSEESGLYKVGITIADTPHFFYLTKDGTRIIFPEGIVSISQLEELTKKAVPKQ
ncbi:MAG: hypothetical protein NC914_01345, partial [Candidatus Omnitrophica bacterium]|nr:hypothetical protein [Candidatus Omnitrophota bacterium]